jgi:hypothetical protein
MLGFVTPTIMHSTTAASLSAIESHPEAHLIHDGSPVANEYFLLENRQPQGFDAQLPGGILIWHVAADIPANDSAEFDHPALRLEEADGRDRLASNRYVSATQVWSASNGMAGGFQDQTGSWEANAQVYLPGVPYRRFDQPDNHTRIRVSNFSASQEVMTYDLRTVVPSVASERITPSTYSVNWTPASDATRHELQTGEALTLTTFSDDAEDGDRFHEHWISLGMARRSAGGAKSGKYSYMLAGKDESNDAFLSREQALQLRAPFIVGPDFTLSFWVASHITGGKGFLAVQVSKDGGASWITIDYIQDNIPPFAPADLHACRFRH